MHIVVGIDGSEEALGALRLAADAAVRQGADLVIIEALPAELPLVAARRTTAKPAGPPSLQGGDPLDLAVAATRRACPPGWPIRAERVVGSAGHCLVEAAEGAEIVVVGSRPHGDGRHGVIGSTGAHLSHHAPCPVVIGAGEDAASGRVVVGIDGSGPAAQAAAWAAVEAERRGSSLEVVHCFSPPLGGEPVGAITGGAYDDVQSEAGRLVATTIDQLGACHPGLAIEGRIAPGPPGEVLVELAKGAELLVVGATGAGAFGRVLLGSAGRHLTHHSPCPLVIVRGRAGIASQAQVGL